MSRHCAGVVRVIKLYFCDACMAGNSLTLFIVGEHHLVVLIVFW